MKKGLYCILIPIFLSLVLTGCVEVTANKAGLKKIGPVTQIFAFGDSYSDSGASFRLTQKMVNKKLEDATILPGDLYWKNRWTNGPTAVEVLAKHLRVPLTNYAVGGAKSGNGNYYHWMDPYEDTGVLGQIEKFHVELQGRGANPGALFFIFISANDYFEHIDYNLPGTASDLADTAVANICTAVAQLARLGAQHFMIVNSTDLSKLPVVTEPEQKALAQEFQTHFNSELLPAAESLQKHLDIKITLFDHIALSNKIWSNPQKYGLRNLSTPCQPVYPAVKPVCQSPDTHYYWDEWHPTRRVHQIAGKAMAATLSK
ncbi:SGNH/GDSL hydrolase family protein [Desulfobulbus rhabdoformis]|uniref:SGNH/GDSL hydrolase family protein n=1 Tax=Desulfobulbus rhabdoformis TaxID=34032 RepID=UPI00196430C5|nr:SGNH/GDSL hydrolase family protein [Desulfobulbus rhabdoformis]MBM9615879.1 SGNH/GDSL hydrolase family protein [Desulfobulbus rhabdoformis]